MGESINDVFSYFDPASLVLFSSGSSSGSYYSALDHLDRAESKIPEVICIDDSPQSEEATSVSGGTCPSVYECDNGSSVKEISINSRPSSRNSFSSRTGLVDDFDVEQNETREDPWPEEETASRENSESERSKVSVEEPVTRPIFRSRIISLKDFTIPCLESISSLKERFGSGCKYQLTLNPRKNGCRPRKVSRKRLYKYKRDLQNDLEQWETNLNEKSRNEAYIAVENVVDNERPPKDFTYITHNILHPDISHLFDINYLVGCTCERVCTQECCECPRNSGGELAYDRAGKVRVEPGTPIYECNSRCPCGLSCRNRVLQRGRTVKVAVFRTSNGCGWGVKTVDPIEKNQLVTEYVGEAITQEEAEERGKVYDSCGQTYLFDLDFNDGECLYTLDAKKYGNISHFINHSCNPNLSVYAVWVDTLDPNFPRIALFANRNIKIGEELTFDYQMSGVDSGSPGISPRKPNHIKCNCGSDNCRTYLF